MERSLVRNRSLDGMRGLAAILILLHHHALLNSGWLGVDVFFVLSGYLITTIIRRDRADEFFWSNFWIKRVTRILPPVVLLIAAMTLVFHLNILNVAAYLGSFGDVIAYIRPFTPAADTLWSLAIEEHFYMFWPFAVRYLERRSLIYLLSGIIVLEPLARAISCLFTKDWRFDYYLTPFRLDGLAFGSLLAILLESRATETLIRRWSSWCIALTCATWFVLRLSLGDEFTRPYASYTYNGLAYSIISGASFALLAYVVTHPDSRTSKMFAWRAMVFTGTISYGLYCYQIIIRDLVMTRLHISFKRALWVDLPLTYLVAYLSYRFYERPITLWGRSRQRVSAPRPKDENLAGQAAALQATAD
jgi:peptidoglycan/LPS O-acetylase OafA/YrhL